ncbi:MAG TPA: hypothetical protein VGQ45_03875 [Gaiellales bacterium]|nr:hypothetical protein [Gaiellales bacterium]
MHEIIANYDVDWMPGPGREDRPRLGLDPEPLLDKRIDHFVGWSCSCGADGTTTESMLEHSRPHEFSSEGVSIRMIRRGA